MIQVIDFDHVLAGQTIGCRAGIERSDEAGVAARCRHAGFNEREGCADRHLLLASAG
jgi:FKBP-type peptidyl-prolyl cis-trans isomerase 2